MSKTKYLKGACQNCGGHIEFPAEQIGITIPCPHCQQETELTLLPPAQEPALPVRVLVWTGLAVIVLVLGLGIALVALKRAQRWAERQKQRATARVEQATNTVAVPAATNSKAEPDLSASDVGLEKTPGSSLVYAVGIVRNGSNRQRFGVKVELELTDAAGQPIGTATDYRQVLEPGAQWQFKALVVQTKAVSAQVVKISEEP